MRGGKYNDFWRLLLNFSHSLKQCFLAILLFFALAVSCSQSALANDKYASIVIDADTGMVLHERYADKVLHPASLTKIMTLYIVFEELKVGNIRLNDRVRISKHAASMVPSKLDLAVGSSISVEDAIYALVTKSANDIAVALGEHVAGSEWAFAKRMTREARHIGMAKTTFTNASGLPDKRQVSSARDMSRLARAMLHNHPSYYTYFKTKNFSYRGRSYHNHNRLMSSYQGMDGIKTGYINASGFNLVASAKRGNRRLVGVVFGGRTSRTRNAHMAKLLDAGFTKVNQMYRNGPVVAQVPVPFAKPGTIANPIQLASIEPAATFDSVTRALTAEKPRNTPSSMDEALGQGDIEPDVMKRIETSLMSMAVHTNSTREVAGIGTYSRRAISAPQAITTKAVTAVANEKPATFSLPVYPYRKPTRQMVRAGIPINNWSIQVGTYTGRIAADSALKNAVGSLPIAMADNKVPLIVPLRTGAGIVFRGRLQGFSESEARQACSSISNCLVIAP